MGGSGRRSLGKVGGFGGPQAPQWWESCNFPRTGWNPVKSEIIMLARKPTGCVILCLSPSMVMNLACNLVSRFNTVVHICGRVFCSVDVGLAARPYAGYSLRMLRWTGSTIQRFRPDADPSGPNGSAEDRVP